MQHNISETATLRRIIDVYGIQKSVMLELLLELGSALCRLNREKSKEAYDNAVNKRVEISILLDILALYYDDLDVVSNRRTEAITELKNQMEA